VAETPPVSVPPGVTIRSASSADVPDIEEVYRRSSLSNEGDRPLFALHPELLDWSNLEALREERIRVAVSTERVVGFSTLLVAEGTALVDDLFVDADWQRRGIGRALVEDMSLAAGRAGLGSIEVDANPHAQVFYASVGFVPVGEVAVEYGTGLRMRRNTARTSEPLEQP
jgi:ribosomal protein S18 acetylase RimI-like enzyme